MYHCTLEDKPTVVIASDTDILILTLHVFASRLPDHDWFLQTKKNQFMNVSNIHNSCRYLPIACKFERMF